MLDEIGRTVPKLRHARGSRWPMIMWQAGPFEPQAPEVYQELLARGVTQHIRLDEAMIPTARALQAAGSPVIMMEGKGGNYPYSAAGDPAEWRHQFDDGYAPDEGEEIHACPAMIKGWAINADRIRASLQRFKDAGVTVNAVWMDWEVEPAAGAGNHEQAANCARCRATLPKSVLANEKAYDAYCLRKYVELVATYLAAPVAEIFPGCSTTNWGAMVVSPLHPMFGWRQGPFHPRVPAMFTATNPVAYGMTMFFEQWKPEYPLDREHVDQLYSHLLLREVSNETANRKIFAPHLQSIPWVTRWCNDGAQGQDAKRPIMSRERYREVLRHLWLRGIRAMQVFNPVQPGYEEMALYEVQDAAAVYDEMLEFRDLLDAGEAMNLAVPKIQDSGVVWSGVRFGDRAVVRAFKQGGGTGRVTIEAWPKKRTQLTATAAGDTYLLERQSDQTISLRKLTPTAR
jgi:hypothetical protein